MSDYIEYKKSDQARFFLSNGKPVFEVEYLRFLNLNEELNLNWITTTFINLAKIAANNKKNNKFLILVEMSSSTNYTYNFNKLEIVKIKIIN